MSVYLQRVTEYYHWSMEAGDPRTTDWFLMSSPLYPIVLVTIYLLVLYFGPKIMENRPAFDLKPILVIYNFGLVVLSVYMAAELLLSVYAIPNFNWLCQGVEYNDDPKLLRHANVQWLFFVSKIVEFVETFFFIFRKKNNQVSFLHVYHHASMCLLWWTVVRWNAGGTSYFGACLNSVVHSVMYSYYLLSSLGPQYRKYLWWKKYLTAFQIVQFITFLAYILINMCIPGCTYSHSVLWLFFCYNVSLVFLFGKFFIGEYINKHKTAKKAN